MENVLREQGVSEVTYFFSMRHTEANIVSKHPAILIAAIAVTTRFVVILFSGRIEGGGRAGGLSQSSSLCPSAMIEKAAAMKDNLLLCYSNRLFALATCRRRQQCSSMGSHAAQ
jgi:hypothetical protein